MQRVQYWKLVVLEHYAEFSGRASRAELWWFFLANLIIIVLVLSVLGRASVIFTVIGGLYSLALIIPGLAVAMRTLHDLGKSGWWLLLNLIPFIGSIILLVFYVQEGQPATYAYGPPPPSPPPA